MSKYNVDSSIKGCLVGAIAESKGNLSKVADLTGLSRATCYRLIKKYAIDLEGFRKLHGGTYKLGRSN